MELRINTKDNCYTLSELLGEGSFGCIYKSKDMFGKNVAVKLVFVYVAKAKQ